MYVVGAHGSVCPMCREKDRSASVKEWQAGLGKTRERRTFVTYEIKETAYYPWKLDPSVILVVEP